MPERIATRTSEPLLRVIVHLDLRITIMQRQKGFHFETASNRSRLSQLRLDKSSVERTLEALYKEDSMFPVRTINSSFEPDIKCRREQVHSSGILSYKFDYLFYSVRITTQHVYHIINIIYVCYDYILLSHVRFQCTRASSFYFNFVYSYGCSNIQKIINEHVSDHPFNVLTT